MQRCIFQFGMIKTALIVMLCFYHAEHSIHLYQYSAEVYLLKWIRHFFYIFSKTMQPFSIHILHYFNVTFSSTCTSKHVRTWITMTTVPPLPSTVSGSAGVQQLSRGRGVCVGEPVFRPRPSQAAAPLERPGDRLRWAARRASHAQPAGRPGVLGRRSSVAQDPALEDG